MTKKNQDKREQIVEAIERETCLSRRQVVQGLLASAVMGPIFFSCSGDSNGTPDGGGDGGVREVMPEPVRKNYPMEVKGYKGLAELPFFELDKEGRLRVVVDDMPPAIDFHTHLAFCVGKTPKVDFLKASPKTQYLLDCDSVEGALCNFNMEKYINEIATDKMKEELERGTLSCMIGDSTAAMTHTLPNLKAELDMVKFDKAVIHPIAINLIQPDNITEHWSNAIKAAKMEDHFISFCSVHPKAKKSPVEQLREYHKQGFRGVKFHPTMQKVAPDDDKAMEIFQECAKLKMMVFFHAGRAGIEPADARPFAEMKHYEKPIKEFPNLDFVFGHSGCRDWREALDIAKKHKNVWLDFHGQGIPQLKTILKEFDKERIVFGSDWPFYPLAATLAKIFIITEDDKTVRDNILANNAKNILKKYGMIS